MRDRTEGEFQALRAAAEFLIFIGLAVAIFVAEEGKYLWVAVGLASALAGSSLGIWLMRKKKRADKSAKRSPPVP